MTSSWFEAHAPINSHNAHSVMVTSLSRRNIVFVWLTCCYYAISNKVHQYIQSTLYKFMRNQMVALQRGQSIFRETSRHFCLNHCGPGPCHYLNQRFQRDHKKQKWVESKYHGFDLIRFNWNVVRKTRLILCRIQCVKPAWHSDAIWRQSNFTMTS